MNVIILFLIILFNKTEICFANEPNKASEESANTSQRFGPGKAIEAFDKEQGFKLSDKSASAMSITFRRLDSPSPWQLPKEAIIHLKQSTGVYRKYDGWISLVLVKIVKREGDVFFVTSQDLESSDEVAITGAPFLRMTDADLNSGTVDSCAH